MDDFKKLSPIQKQITVATVQVLYETGFDEDQVIKMMKNTHRMNLSQEVVRHLYGQFVRADIQADVKMSMLLEFSGS